MIVLLKLKNHNRDLFRILWFLAFYVKTVEKAKREKVTARFAFFSQLSQLDGIFFCHHCALETEES